MSAKAKGVCVRLSVLGMMVSGWAGSALAQEGEPGILPPETSAMSADAEHASNPESGAPAGEIPATPPSSEPVAADANGNTAPAEAAPEPYPETVAVDAVEESAAEDSAPRQSQSRLVDEIIVTAQKREENVQDVPISIQAFSADMLDAMGVKNTRDLQFSVPSLNFGEYSGYALIYLRGVGTDAFLTADPSIATYVDGVYLPSSFLASSDFGAIDRVEVLKGPQGTLFGRNAVGGAVAIYTKDPELDNFSADAVVSYGKFDEANMKGNVNIPLGDRFAMILSGNYRAYDFHYNGMYGGTATQDGPQEWGREESTGYRVKAFWLPHDDFSVMYSYGYSDYEGFGTNVAPNFAPTIITQLAGGQAQTENFRADLNRARGADESQLHIARIQYSGLPLDIKLSASNQYTRGVASPDFDGTSARIAQFVSDQNGGYGVNVTTGELQFVSNSDTPFSEVFQWVFGAYYFESQGGFRRPAALYVDIIDPLVTLYGPTGPLYDPENPLLLANALDAAPFGFSLRQLLDMAPNGQLGFTSGVGTDSIAGFFQGTFHFTDWLALTLGGRYMDEERVANESGTWVGQNDGSFIKVIDRAEQDTALSVFSPKVAVEVRPATDLLFYASYQEATKSGTFNVVNIYDAIDFVVPEEIKAYEVGTKTTLFDGLVQLNAAAWFYDQTNLQTQFISLLKGGAVTFETAPAAESKGVEFDALVLLFPQLIDDLVLTLGGAYVDAIFTDHPNGNGFDPILGTLRTGLDHTGNRVPQTAEYIGTVGLNKTFQAPALAGSFEVGADAYYNSGFFWTAQNVEVSEEPSYIKANARVSYRNDPWDLRLTAFVDNLTDERYNLQIITTDFGPGRHQARPRTYGLRMEMRFD